MAISKRGHSRSVKDSILNGPSASQNQSYLVSKTNKIERIAKQGLSYGVSRWMSE